MLSNPLSLKIPAGRVLTSHNVPAVYIDIYAGKGVIIVEKLDLARLADAMCRVQRDLEGVLNGVDILSLDDAEGDLNEHTISLPGLLRSLHALACDGLGRHVPNPKSWKGIKFTE